MNDPEDIPGRDAIIASLEKRWSKSDQEIFIAAVIVNPFYRMEPFAKKLEFTNARVVDLIERVWIRLHSRPAKSDTPQQNEEISPPREFFQQLLDFIDLSSNGTHNSFHGLERFCALERVRADSQNVAINPINVLNHFKIGSQDSAFTSFARKVLSISANSASCERLFSTFGGIMDKYRNRLLLLKNLLNNAELKMHTRDEHLRNQLVRMSTKKRFKTRSNAAMAEAASRKSSVLQGPLPSSTSSTLTSDPTVTQSVSHDTGDHGPGEDTSDGGGRNVSTLRGLIAIETERLELDDDTPWQDSDEPVTSNPSVLMSLADIFDFDNTHWKTIFEGHALRTFEEELNIYQLLDLEVGAEDSDIDVDVDEITAQTLLGR